MTTRKQQPDTTEAAEVQYTMDAIRYCHLIESEIHETLITLATEYVLQYGRRLVTKQDIIECAPAALREYLQRAYPER